MEDVIPLAVILFICATVFICIGIYALNKKTPMHFWSGIVVKTEEISNVKAYNRANGIMWIIYSLIFIISAIISLLFDSNIGGTISAISATLGLFILVIVYRRIYNKYKNKDY